MAYAVVLSESAAADIVSISEHIAADNPRRAHSFVSELRNSVEKKLAAFPRSGVAIGSLRYTTFGNYVIAYRVDDGSMTVGTPGRGYRKSPVCLCS